MEYAGAIYYAQKCICEHTKFNNCMHVCFQCETYGVAAMDALHTHLLRPPTKVGIIGSGCSLATEPTAEISHYYNLTHVR